MEGDRTALVVSGGRCALCFAEENQRLLVMHPTRGRLLPALLASRVPTIQEQSLALLLQLAQTENGRGLIISHLDLTR